MNPDSLFRHSAQVGLRIGPFLDLLATDRDDSTEPGSAGVAGVAATLTLLGFDPESRFSRLRSARISAALW